MRGRQKEQRRYRKVAREYEKAGDRAVSLGSYSEASSYFERAAEEAEPSRNTEDTVRLWDKVGLSLAYGARPELATPWFERILELCSSRGILIEKIPEKALSLARQRWLESHTTDALSFAKQAQEAAIAMGNQHFVERAAAVVANYLVLLGRYNEALEEFKRPEMRIYDAHSAAAHPPTHALALTQYAIIEAAKGEKSEALVYFEHAVQVGKQTPDGYMLTVTWDDYANWLTILGQMNLARACRERALLVARERGIVWRIPYHTLRFASLLITLGDYEHAHHLFSDAMTYDTSTPVLRVLLCGVGMTLAQALGDEEILRESTDNEAIELALRSGEPQCIASVVVPYAKILIARGEVRHARSLLSRVLTLNPQADLSGELLALAAQYATAEQALLARKVLEARLRLPHHAGALAYYELWKAYDARRRNVEAETQTHGERAAQLFKRLEWRHQQRETLVLIGYHQEPRRPGMRTPAILGDAILELTDREREVTELVLRGLTNRKIAQTLGISEHTVETHMTSILASLGLRSRWQLHDLKSAAASGLQDA